MKTSVLILPALAVLTGCSIFMPSEEVRWQRSLETHAQTLAALYPVGTSIEAVRGGRDTSEIDVTALHSDWFVELCLKHLRDTLGQPVKACDAVLARRGFLGLYRDLVFYGLDGRVVAAYRQFLD